MFVILSDYDNVITKSFFVLILDIEGYFLTMNVVGRSCLHRIVNDIFGRTTCQFLCVCKRVAGTILNTCNDLVNI